MPALQIPAQFNRGGTTVRNQAGAEESALFLIAYICEVFGLDDLREKDVLDVGCGTKFTQAFVNHGFPIKSYTGVDVYGEMIEFLQENVDDPRFDYHHVDIRNELYNPDAPPMTEQTDLGVGDRTFDIIWLFSVFTHLSPYDYSVMLKLLRRYIRPDGRLLYTVFIDEVTDTGFGFTDNMYRALQAGAARDERVRESLATPREVQPFVDVYPSEPLRVALYSREYAHELIEGTGWTPLELRPPTKFSQHQFVLAPT
jgi:SAM-dependent methyltransferase